MKLIKLLACAVFVLGMTAACSKVEVTTEETPTEETTPATEEATPATEEATPAKEEAAPAKEEATEAVKEEAAPAPAAE